MAQFTLSVINNRGETVLTRYDAVTGETAGLTFDENFNLNVDGATLSFAMLKYYYEGSQKVVNTAATTLIYGSQIKLVTNGQQFMFNVQSINYQFMQENLQLNFSCIDAFQFETSKLGLGYTIAEDTTDPNYIGAQPIDSWANKIVRECGLRWQYIPIDRANDSLIRQFNSIDVIQSRDEYSSTDEEAWAERVEDYSIAPKPTNASLNVPVSFSCSNVNAYAALKELATRNELILKYDYTTLNFWFVPQKNPYFKGYYFNPYNNLQAFSVAGNAQNLVTVLNVQGPKDYNDQEILLVPEFPDSVLHFIDTDEWKNSVYYSNLYIDNCATDSDEDDPFYTTSSYTPWLENKLINIDYFKDSGIITDWEYNNIQNTLYNDLRIVNGPLIIQTANYLQKYEEDYMTINQQQMDLERQNGALLADIEKIYNTVLNETLATPVPIYYPRLNDNNIVEQVIGLYLPDITPNDHILYSINNSDYADLDEVDSDDAINDYLIRDPEVVNTTILNNQTTSIGQLQIVENADKDGYKIQVYPSTISYDIDPGVGTDRVFIGQFYEMFNDTLINKFTRLVIRACNQPTLKKEEDASSGLFYKDFTIENGVITSEVGPGGNYELTKPSIGQVFWRLACVQRSSSEVTYLPFYYYIKSFTLKPRALALQLKDAVNTFSPQVSWEACSIHGDEPQPEGQPALHVDAYGATMLTMTLRPLGAPFFLSSVSTVVTGWKPGTQYPNEIFSMSIKEKYNTTSIALAPPFHYDSQGNPIYEQVYNGIEIGDFTATAGHHLYTIKPPVAEDETVLKFIIRNSSQQDSAPLTITNHPSAYTGLYDAWLSGNNLNLQTSSTHSVSTQNVIAGLDERLTEIGASYQTNFNLYAEYMYKFQQYWNKPVGDYTIGLVYSQLRKVGVLSDNNDNIAVGDVYSPAYSITFTESDKLLFEAYYYNGKVQTSPLSREEIIKSCAIIAGQLTEYWNLAYSAAMLLGIFCPSQWDCLDNIERGISSSVYRNQLPLLAESYYNSTTQHWSHAPLINTDVIPEVSVSRNRPYNYKYYNENKEYVMPLLTLPTDLVGYSNTDNYYIPWDVAILTPTSQYANYWGIINQQHRAVIDTDKGYMTKLKITKPQYSITDLSKIKTLSQVIREWIAPARLVGLDRDPISFDNIRYNPSISFITRVAQCAEYNDALYYQLQKERHDIWQHLYTAYPGVFRESNYVNQDAGTSQQLYNAAKAQLNMLSQPQFTYQLTGMDIYMHDSDYMPTRLTIGDQIHIDYQEDSHRQDTLYKALATPLYITSIRHTLRNDGDYQFEVSTTRGTDVMMQRFAQLLSFGK